MSACNCITPARFGPVTVTAGSTCMVCGADCGEFTGTYTHDECSDGALVHVIALNDGQRCPACGDVKVWVLIPCGGLVLDMSPVVREPQAVQP